MTARNSYLLRKYGITEKQYEDLLRKQEFRCGVCRRLGVEFKSRLAVDHDHHTGELRGLLCTMCNRYVIGRHRAGTGGAELLQYAGEYLAGSYTGWFVPKKKPKKRKRKVRK